MLYLSLTPFALNRLAHTQTHKHSHINARYISIFLSFSASFFFFSLPFFLSVPYSFFLLPLSFSLCLFFSLCLILSFYYLFLSPSACFFFLSLSASFFLSISPLSFSLCLFILSLSLPHFFLLYFSLHISFFLSLSLSISAYIYLSFSSSQFLSNIFSLSPKNRNWSEWDLSDTDKDLDDDLLRAFTFFLIFYVSKGLLTLAIPFSCCNEFFLSSCRQPNIWLHIQQDKKMSWATIIKLFTDVINSVTT